MNSNSIKPIAFIVGAAFIGSLALSNAVQAFAVTDLDAGYALVGEQAREDKGTEGKCGEGKCGASKDKSKEGSCGADKKDSEGKCGEGKCGGEKQDEEKGKEGTCGGAA